MDDVDWVILRIMSKESSNKMTRQIVVSRLQTPDGTIITSHNRHDYRTYRDDNGKQYMIDGGRDYIRSSANGDERYMPIYTDDPHYLIRENFTWGTYGKDGKQPLRRVLLKDMDSDHILAILETQFNIPLWVRIIFTDEVWFRRNEHL